MNNLLAPAMQLLRRPITTSAPPLQLRISATAPPPLRIKCSKPSGQLLRRPNTISAPPLQLRISAAAPPPLRIKCYKPSEDGQKPLTAKQKKGKLKALRSVLKSFRKRLVKVVEELQNARDKQREGLSGMRGSPSWKVEKAARAEDVQKKKAKVDSIEEKIQEITKQISEITGGAQ